MTIKISTSLPKAFAAVVISGNLTASAPLVAYVPTVCGRIIEDLRPNIGKSQRSFGLPDTPSSEYRDADEIITGLPDLYGFAPSGGLATVVKTPNKTGEDTTPETRSIAGPVALAAIGALLVGGGLVILSRRLPKDKEDDRP